MSFFQSKCDWPIYCRIFGKAKFAGSRLARLNFTDPIRDIVAQGEQATVDASAHRSGFLDRYFYGHRSVSRRPLTFSFRGSCRCSFLFSVLGQSLPLPSFRDPNLGFFFRKRDSLALSFFLQCPDGDSVMTFSCDGCHRPYKFEHTLLCETRLGALVVRRLHRPLRIPFLKHCNLRQGRKP